MHVWHVISPRLGLERSKDAKEALDTITELLVVNGQGGCCSDEPGEDWAYHNSFLIADSTQAWVLETARAHWAAQKITSTEAALTHIILDLYIPYPHT